MPTAPALFLGSSLALGGAGERSSRHVPAHHLVTHGVIVGMTGSGKTGLVTVTVEEALRCQVPVLRDVHTDEGPVLLQPRHAMSFLRGPMTRTELQRALRSRAETTSPPAPLRLRAGGSATTAGG